MTLRALGFCCAKVFLELHCLASVRLLPSGPRNGYPGWPVVPDGSDSRSSKRSGVGPRWSKRCETWRSEGKNSNRASPRGKKKVELKNEERGRMEYFQQGPSLPGILVV
ncbi:uncharacterized protein B0T23DRAFT_158828 [Neurospora hispaniola]|uniref:Secreted protein n=1 Tax=Neurospora hispaniola TaxID=588809 RepID=A0AAJ0I4W5_9PEZI|nr:hypothetical protein B0T23DRAFT_158828 [Neurospora hispaniola]